MTIVTLLRRLPMSVQSNGHFVQEKFVARVKFQIGRKFHPLQVLGVVASLEVELSDLVSGFVVKGESHGLHPSVVGVARVVDVTDNNKNNDQLSFTNISLKLLFIDLVSMFTFKTV
jgi:hypothetical protein